MIAATLAGVLGYGFYERKNISYIIKEPNSIFYSFEGIDIDLQRRLNDNGYNTQDNLGVFIDFNMSDLYFLRKLSRENYSNLIDKEKLEKDLLERLGSKDHTYRKHKDYMKRYGIPDESNEQIKKCNVVQLLKLYIALHSFENKEFCNQMGRLIKEDLKDNHHEHGGLVKLRDLKLIFKNYPSIAYGNEFYLPPDEYEREANKKGCFANYHFHATTEDDTIYSGPSGYWNYYGGDIFTFVMEWTFDEGFGEFVITKLKGNNFNVDFCLKDYTEENPGIVIDLGNYSY